MIIKTYAMFGYMDFTAQIKTTPNQTIKIEFSGGKQNGYGTRPATFKTSDPVLQKLIERSPMFQKGRISLHLVEGKTEPATEARTNEARLRFASGTNNETGAEADSGSEASAEGEGGGEARSFSTVGEAAAFLKDGYGIALSRCRTKDSCIAEAAALGLEITIG